MALVTLKRNDYGASLQDTLTVNGTAVNLTGASVFFVMSDRDGDEVVRRAATILSESAGTVSCAILSTDTDLAGDYRQEWEVVYTSPAQNLTFPNDGYNTIRIIADLA